MTKSRRKICNSGFTVVELLITVGIVAVLAALVMTVARPISDKAAFAACTSNLRQIGAGMAMYAGENNGELPYSDKTEHLPDWSSNSIYDRDIQDWRSLGRTYQYLPAKKVFYCRKVSVFGDHHTVNWDPTPAQSLWGSYTMRGYNQSYVQPGTVKLGSWAGRAIVSCFFMNSPNFGVSQKPKVSYHDGRFPVLFGDGSVQTCRMPDVIDIQGKQPIWESTALQFQIWDSFDKQRKTDQTD